MIPGRFRGGHIYEFRGGVAHLVELQDGERRRLLVSLVGIVIAVRKGSRRQQGRGEPG
ncbi:hypothetical protein D3C83_325930 [compost metagenome]